MLLGLLLLLGMMQEPQLAIVATEFLYVFSEVSAEEVGIAQYEIVIPETLDVLLEGTAISVLAKKTIKRNDTEWGFIEYLKTSFFVEYTENGADTLCVVEANQGWVLLRLKAKYFVEFLEKEEKNQNLFDFLGGSIFLFGQSPRELEEALDTKIDLRGSVLLYIAILMGQLAFVCVPFFKIHRKAIVTISLWLLTTVAVGLANWGDIQFVMGGFK